MFRQLLVSGTLLLGLLCPCKGEAEAQWTIMIYFDGKELIRENSACLMEQLRSIKPRANVNIVVEMSLNAPVTGTDMQEVPNDRCPDDGDLSIYEWNGVRRFHVDASGKFAQDADRGNIDLNSSAELQDFLTNTQQLFKASHYMVIIKNHGPEVPLIALDSRSLAFLEPEPLTQFTSFDDGSSADDEPNSILTTSDPEYELSRLLSVNVEKAIVNSFGQNKIDILAFDSCYRSFLETAYDFKTSANYFVASELVTKTETRWHYSDWLDKIIVNPSIQPADITGAMVDSQAQRYGTLPDVTLNSLDLSKIDALANSFDQVASELTKSISSSAKDILAARPKPFASVNLDLFDFLQGVTRLTMANQTEVNAKIRAFRNMYLASTESFPAVNPNSNQPLNGLAIYFPCTVNESGALEIASYNPRDPKPIPFVKDHSQWSNFLILLLSQPVHTVLTGNMC